MVVDLRPATCAVATLARILWGVAGSSPARATCALYALCARVESRVRNRSSVLALPFCVRFFLIKRTFINLSLGVIGISLRGVAEQSAADTSQGSCWSPR